MPEILFRLNGALVPRVRFPNVTIHDVIGSQPNTGQLVMEGLQPTVGSAIDIGRGSFAPADLLFGGAIQALESTYQSRPIDPLLEYPASLIDHVFALNKRRPFQFCVNESASSVVANMVGYFAPGFTWNHVQADLPPVTMNFDGTRPLMECLADIAQQIGARCKVDYSRDVHFFIPPEPGIVPPDPVDNQHPPLNSPPISFEIDLSQVRTRVYGKGAGQTVVTDIAPTESILPIGDAVMFNPTGGRALAGLTDEGAQTQQVTYTGTQVRVGGSFVGRAITPAVAPAVSQASGLGLGSGSYWYAYTFVTATGETTPSPIGALTLGAIAQPGTAPTVAAQPGAGLDIGDYTYAITFVTATGETTLGLNSASVSCGYADLPTTAPALNFGSPSGGFIPKPPGTRLWYTYTYANAGGETTRGPISNGLTQAYYANPSNSNGPFITAYGSSDSRVSYLRFYRSEDGTTFHWFGEANNPGAGSAVTINDPYFTVGGAPPSTNGCGTLQVQLTELASGPAAVTARRIYRWSPQRPTWGLVTTLADNTTNSYRDTKPNASLGTTPPASNTALANQVQVTAIAVGPSGTTSRKLYRTVVNGGQLKLLATLADNTTTSYGPDNTADGSLGANVPTADTSGLVETKGSVMPSAATLPTAGAAPFFAIGGWALVNQQVIRYTGISGSDLTGIPTSGTGAITATIPYGASIVPIPALTGVSARQATMARGSAVHLFVQRDDVPAQQALGQMERDPAGQATDGIREYFVSDERRGETSLGDLCQADLDAFSRPTVTVRYATHDPKSRAGQTVYVGVTQSDTWISGPFNPAIFNQQVFNTRTHPALGYTGDYIIQAVTVTIDASVDPMPRYGVEASSTRFTFMDLLQRVLMRT